MRTSMVLAVMRFPPSSVSHCTTCQHSRASIASAARCMASLASGSLAQGASLLIGGAALTLRQLHCAKYISYGRLGPRCGYSTSSGTSLHSGVRELHFL